MKDLEVKHKFVYSGHLKDEDNWYLKEDQVVILHQNLEQVMKCAACSKSILDFISALGYENYKIFIEWLQYYINSDRKKRKKMLRSISKAVEEKV